MLQILELTRYHVNNIFDCIKNILKELKLGSVDISFREQKKWKAAEAAYKEAVNVWPGNTDALLELGLLYLDRNRIEEAQQTYSKLRPLNASYAADLLAEINRYKTTLAH